jgi:hypothetical protein
MSAPVSGEVVELHLGRKLVRKCALYAALACEVTAKYYRLPTVDGTRNCLFSNGIIIVVDNLPSRCHKTLFVFVIGATECLPLLHISSHAHVLEP